ncbi:threonine aldolase family protein [Chitinophaga sedimenti]|uniref:threonine aldolase family protein n=1 Tax=Chitinophaga sedimenti TaxID=2033606 RepID=UPI00249F566D|nr:beta-eliminating lyase-related protein [Chitinophaga sedimenti]
MITDLRSDTFTRPSAGMLEAMLQAQTGDDVWGEDPSVNQLEATMAEQFGMEAALYCPSGTMSNQIAIKVHTQPGDELICGQHSHVYIYEGGGIAFNSGVQTKPIESDRGMLAAADIVAAINPDDVHKARTSIVSLENTSNRGGGCCYEWEQLEQIRAVCDHHELALHRTVPGYTTHWWLPAKLPKPTAACSTAFPYASTKGWAVPWAPC